MTEDHIPLNRRIEYNEDRFDDIINGIITASLIVFAAWGSYTLIKDQYEYAKRMGQERTHRESPLALD